VKPHSTPQSVHTQDDLLQASLLNKVGPLLSSPITYGIVEQRGGLLQAICVHDHKADQPPLLKRHKYVAIVSTFSSRTFQIDPYGYSPLEPNGVRPSR
jgi:hypothetical protein